MQEGNQPSSRQKMLNVRSEIEAFLETGVQDYICQQETNYDHLGQIDSEEKVR